MQNALSKADQARQRQQNAEGLFGALFAATRTSRQKAAGISTPNPGAVQQQAPSLTQMLADAERRAGRPLMEHERQMVESAAAQAAVLHQIKSMHAGVQPTPSTGPTAL